MKRKKTVQGESCHIGQELNYFSPTIPTKPLDSSLNSKSVFWSYANICMYNSTCSFYLVKPKCLCQLQVKVKTRHKICKLSHQSCLRTFAFKHNSDAQCVVFLCVWGKELSVLYDELLLTLFLSEFNLCFFSGSTCWFGNAAETRQREPTGAAVQAALCLAVVRISYLDMYNIYYSVAFKPCSCSLFLFYLFNFNKRNKRITKPKK